jgi:hypothetical protein
MSKKPAATLSSNLVAVKGTAMPAPDMPGRGAPTAVGAVPPDFGPKPERSANGDASGMPLNFRVTDAFRRDFKVYAAQHGLKLNELLRRSFEAYRRQNGG